MYRLLDLYEKDYDKLYPVVCMDEKSKQLIEDVRGVLPLKPGSTAKYDYEYRRNGTRNIFVAVEPLGGRRKMKIKKWADILFNSMLPHLQAECTFTSYVQTIILQQKKCCC